MKKNKKRLLSAFESFIYKLCILAITCLILGIVFFETTLAQKNVEIQKLEHDVEKIKIRNESLNMKIDELISLDNIKEISNQYGLTYRSENIKTID